MRVSKFLPFGEWLPDLPDYMNPGATEAKNVIPVKQSYRPISSLQSATTALPARALSAVAARDDDGATHDFAATSTGLYKLTSTNAWADVSKLGGYSTGALDTWNWAKWGEQVIATNFADPVQTYTLGTSTLFADLAAGAPQARYIDVLRDFVVVGNTYDSTDGNVPYRVRWSAIGDPTDWTVSATTQSDYQDLNSADGQVQGVVGREYGIVFQEKAIHRMTYVGSPTVFQFDKVEKNHGLFIPTSLASRGQTSFYLAEDGFYAFTHDRSVPIGAEKVDKWFYANLNESYKDRVRSAIDPINKLVIWAYPSTSSNGTPDRLVIFNWTENKWSYAEIDCETLFGFLSLGYTLETLDTVSTNVDAMTISLDSRFWMGEGSLVLAAFDTSHQLASFTGTVLSAVMETSEFQLFDGHKACLNRLRPVVDATSTIQVGKRNLDTDSTTWTSAASTNSSGNATVRSNAFRHRVRVNTSGSFSHAQGVEVLEASKGGRR